MERQDIAHDEAEAAVRERREHGRVALRDLECDLGVVIDVSAGGLRLVSRRRLSGDVDVELRQTDEAPISARAKVVWSRRLGRARHLSGLEFRELSEETGRRLRALAEA